MAKIQAWKEKAARERRQFEHTFATNDNVKVCPWVLRTLKKKKQKICFK